jgi:hypothetical protein
VALPPAKLEPTLVPLGTTIPTPSAAAFALPPASPMIPLETPTAYASGRPTVSGYQHLEDLSQWNSAQRRPLAVTGWFVKGMGISGRDYVFTMRLDTPEPRPTTQSLLVTYEGIPDPAWRPGTHLVVYGFSNGFTDLLGTRIPLLLADGIELR